MILILKKKMMKEWGTLILEVSLKKTINTKIFLVNTEEIDKFEEAKKSQADYYEDDK